MEEAKVFMTVEHFATGEAEMYLRAKDGRIACVKMDACCGTLHKDFPVGSTWETDFRFADLTQRTS